MINESISPRYRPRRVPLSTRACILFGGPFGGIGWFFFAFGMIFVWAMASYADMSSFFIFRGPLKTTDGIITAIENTHFSEGGGKRRRGTPVFKFHYRFTSEGKTNEGICYQTGKNAAESQTVPVEFVPGHPENSRIQGMRKAALSPSVLFVLIFPIIGLGLVLPGIWKGLKHIKLLQEGELTTGRFLRKDPTNVTIAKQPVYKLTFEFVDSFGEKRLAFAKTHLLERLQDDRRETLFYNSRNPTESVLLDSLSGNPALTETGDFRDAPFGRTLLVIILPLAALLVIVGGAYLRFFL